MSKVNQQEALTALDKDFKDAQESIDGLILRF
jgi:hypothetical protein